MGVFSGGRLDELNFYADLIHPIESLRPFEFREYEITRTPEVGHIESGRMDLPAVFVRFFAPINIINIISSVATLLFIMWACLIHDAIAAMALALMALTSFLVGWALWWDPLAMKVSGAYHVPVGDVVIRTREGAFLVIHCSKDIAREIYFRATDEAQYRVSDTISKALVGLGTLTFMAGVVLLGNSSWTMQVVIGVAYLILNGAYWVAAILPQRWTWDLSHYKVVRRHAHRDSQDGVNPNYTRTLWYAIRATREIRWVTITGAVPPTDTWRTWLGLAYEHLDNPDWDAIGEIDILMSRAMRA
jgi:hypothetical protein